MANTVLLDTRTANFLDLIGNGKIYHVPPYQRDYSWTEEQWEDLWNDIMEVRERASEHHYMGAMVIENETDRKFHIIDGQQRLATLSILALAIIKQLRDLVAHDVDKAANEERAKRLRNRFIGEKDPASLQESSKLFLNETDDPFYQDYLVQLREPHNPRGLPKSNKLLWRCFEYFNSKLKALPDLAKNGEALAVLLNETVARQLLFILISVDDEVSAYTVFETLNARGLELSSTDLLKNYLFSRVKVQTDLATLQRRWRNLIATVRQERFPEFLRYHLLCSYRQVRKRRLFKTVRSTVREPQQVFELMEALEARAELFVALSDPQHEYWIERPHCKPYIKELKLFGARQMTPVLFAAWEKFDADDFTRALKLVAMITFRYTIVSKLNTNGLEPIYHDAAKGILQDELTSPRAVFDKLRSIYGSDDKFKQDFAFLEIDTTHSRKKIAKYILGKLEADTAERAFDAETDPATIEHILPENPASDWADVFPEERWASSIYRLGNLSLLEASANRRIANDPYQDKLVAYGASTYQITKAITDMAPEEWTPALLDRRQQTMAERASHIWRSDFDCANQ